MHSKIKLKRHLELHKFLDRKLELLVAEFEQCTNSNINITSIAELIKWSKLQTHEKSIYHIEPKKGGE